MHAVNPPWLLTEEDADELNDLERTGRTRVARSSWQTAGRGGRTVTGEDIPVLTADEIRRLPERRALVLGDRGRPVLAALTRSIEGRAGARLLAEQQLARQRLSDAEPEIRR